MLIPISFENLKIPVDVDFLLLLEQVVTLLSMRDIIENSLELSIQRGLITHGYRQQKRKFDKYFLTHTRDPKDMPYASYGGDWATLSGWFIGI